MGYFLAPLRGWDLAACARSNPIVKPKTIMLIAGEASGDLLAAELVVALRAELTAADIAYTTAQQPLKTGLEPRFFGAGGPRMLAAGVDLAFDLTEEAVLGVPGIKTYLAGRRRFHQLLHLARQRQPDVIIGVDYNYFNLAFARAIRRHIRARRGWFHDWQPKLVKYISPQVWASREGRAHDIARDFDLLLTIFPFEKECYARSVPELRVEFVGHPMVERFQMSKVQSPAPRAAGARHIVLLPGSRRKELRRHIPVMLDALKLLRSKQPGITAKMILPDSSLTGIARDLAAGTDIEVQTAGLSEALAGADLAIAKTGTVTMECALFGVPAVTLYKTTWLNYEVAKRIVTVNSLTMPNLLANEEVFPEFLQHDATAENIARAALELLQDEARRAQIKLRLGEIVASLGGPGANARAAKAIAKLLP
jgi:lipid-A-disaccharide synthase